MEDFISQTIAALRSLRGAPMQIPATTPAAPQPEPAQNAPSGPSVPDAAVGLATQFEGFSATPYQDPVGVWTIGYGSTRDLDGSPVCAATLPITDTQGVALMRRDMMGAALECSHSVKVHLTATQLAALEDFIYNLGAANFRSSTLLRKLNSGDYAGAAAEFDKWDQAGGKVLAGLLRRRQAETVLFQTPSTGA